MRKRFEVTREEMIQAVYETDAPNKERAEFIVETGGAKYMFSHNCGALKDGRRWVYEIPRNKSLSIVAILWGCGIIGMVAGITVMYFAF